MALPYSQAPSFEKLVDHPLLSPQEEIALAKKAQSKNKRLAAAAINELVRCNMKLVVRIATEFNKFGGTSNELDDLVSEGAIGLKKAAERFDTGFKAKFSTYAAWWVRQAITRYIANTGKTIRTPVHLQDKVRRIARIRAEMRSQLGSEPTLEEIAEATGVTVEKIERILEGATSTVSLDSPLNETDPTTTLADILKDESAQDPSEITQKNQEAIRITKLVQSLTPREQTVLKGRFGLGGSSPETLETIGKRLKITRERIRQIQNIALRKLRRKLEKKTHTSATEVDLAQVVIPQKTPKEPKTKTRYQPHPLKEKIKNQALKKMKAPARKLLALKKKTKHKSKKATKRP